jgi:hypothetical protein
MTAQYGKEVDMATELRSVPVNATNEPLDRRLHDIGWGLLLMLTGMIWLVPAERVPEGAWLVGVAAILLGLNAVRYVKHISVSGFSSYSASRHFLPRSAGSGARTCQCWRFVS